MAETKKTIKKSLFEGEETVKIRLPITRNEKEDKWVAVNGKPMLIKRGMDVEVPASIAEVLRHQEEMLIKVAENEDAGALKANANELS